MTIDDPKKTVVRLARNYGISRQAVYQIVNEMEKGNEKALEKCIALGRFDCLWEYKYKPLYDVIKNTRTVASKTVLKAMIKRMLTDKFSLRAICKYIKRDRSTIIRLMKTK